MSELVTGVTHHGALLAWDIRAGLRPVWRGVNASSHGLVTCFCVDPLSRQWAVLGTSAGKQGGVYSG